MVTVFITFIVRHKRCALLRTCQVLASAISCNFVNVCYSYFLVSIFADSTSSTTSHFNRLYIYYFERLRREASDKDIVGDVRVCRQI